MNRDSFLDGVKHSLSINWKVTHSITSDHDSLHVLGHVSLKAFFCHVWMHVNYIDVLLNFSKDSKLSISCRMLQSGLSIYFHVDVHLTQ